MSDSIIAAIVAGGTGTRMGQTKVPKQFLDLEGKPVIIHTVDRFLSCSQIDRIILGVHADWEAYLNELLDRYYASSRERILVTSGGADRNDTIANIVRTAKAHGADESTVAVSHDAVRPFVTEKLIDDCISSMKLYDVCTAVIPSTDTIAVSADGTCITDMPVRSRVYRLQTPQCFRIGDFIKVYESLDEEEKNCATDVCRLFLQKGYRVGMVEGSIDNIKITYPQDLKS